MSDQTKIQSVYSQRDISSSDLYTWHRPEVRQWEGEKLSLVASLLLNTLGSDLHKANIMDVGCGTGSFLRTLVEWGAQPSNLLGTEFLHDRLDTAVIRSPSGIRWHLGKLNDVQIGNFDLVSTHTVFSSVIEDYDRIELANDMWRFLKPGGWILVFDFRYNNPSNKDVRKVTRNELVDFWPKGVNSLYQTLLLAPPLARILVPLPPMEDLPELVAATSPMHRSQDLLGSTTM